MTRTADEWAWVFADLTTDAQASVLIGDAIADIQEQEERLEECRMKVRKQAGIIADLRRRLESREGTRHDVLILQDRE